MSYVGVGQFEQIVAMVYGDSVTGMAAALALRGATPLIDGAIPIGEEFVAENSNYPRVVLVQTDGELVGREMWNSVNPLGQSMIPDVNGNNAIKTLPAIAAERSNVEAHIWGQDASDARDLMHQLVRSIMGAVSSGGVVFRPYQWVFRTKVAKSGRKILLPFTLTYPITATAIQTPAGIAKPIQPQGQVYIDNAGNATGTNGTGI